MLCGHGRLSKKSFERCPDCRLNGTNCQFDCLPDSQNSCLPILHSMFKGLMLTLKIVVCVCVCVKLEGVDFVLNRLRAVAWGSVANDLTPNPNSSNRIALGDASL